MYIELLVLGSYIALTTFVGRRQQDEGLADYETARRKLGPFATALATHTTDMSAWLFVGLPAAAYLYGIASLYDVAALIIAMLSTWIFIAGRLREKAQNRFATTFPDFLSRELGGSKMVRGTAAVLLAAWMIPYIAAGLAAIGKILHNVVGIPHWAGVLIGAIGAGIYAIWGGMKEISRVDIIHGSIVFLVMVVFPFVLLAKNPVNFSSLLQATPLQSSGTLWTTIISAAAWGIGYFGQPHILINFISMSPRASLKKAASVGIIWQSISMISAVLVGLLGKKFIAGISNPEMTFVRLLYANLPGLLAALALCAAVAASLSTVDTQILVSAESLGSDLMRSLFGPYLHEKTEMKMTRWAGALSLSMASLIALDSTIQIFQAVKEAWCGLGSTFGPLVFALLYSPEYVNSYSALSSMFLGSALVYAWRFFGEVSSGMPSIIAFAAGLLVAMSPGLFGKARHNGGETNQNSRS